MGEAKHDQLMHTTMKTTTETGTRLNNAQRKALADIVGRQLDGRVSDARAAESKLEAEIIGEIADRFKIGSLDSEIERLEKQIKNLNARKEELGFRNRYGGGYEIAGGEARKLLETKLRNRSTAITTLEQRKDVIQRNIWLATTVEQAQGLANDADTIN